MRYYKGRDKCRLPLRRKLLSDLLEEEDLELEGTNATMDVVEATVYEVSFPG